MSVYEGYNVRFHKLGEMDNVRVHQLGEAINAACEGANVRLCTFLRRGECLEGLMSAIRLLLMSCKWEQDKIFFYSMNLPKINVFYEKISS